jgi:ABC-type transport system involved in multi-copper enzyme maturation permease subunit
MAIFHDAYRGLKARKMFWVVLVIYALVVGVFACLGITDRGVKVLFWELDFGLTAKDMSPATFYKVMFTALGIEFWLSWVATILALISTAGIFPAFIASGSIDLVVSRPIGRIRLFFTQYVAGLLFVALQITLFCLASFLVIGLRGGAWEPGIFLAIPLVLCFFSYLYSVCVLLGVLWRSTVAALLLTILFWALLAGLHGAEATVLTIQLQEQQELRYRGVRIEALEARVRAGQAATRRSSASADEQSALREELARLRRQYDRTASGVGKLKTAHRILYGVKTVLPKTSETIDLLERTLIHTAELPGADEEQEPGPGRPKPRSQVATRQLVQELRGRSAARIIGTSLAFELIVLALAAAIFHRRDF